jgi:ATP-dependent 26S proteasome regulatory subunit
MGFVLEVRFGKSSSVNYEKALKYAKGFSHFNAISEDNMLNTVTLGANELRNKTSAFRALWGLIQNWKTTELILNGEVIGYQERNRIMRILRCADEYRRAVIQENHCKVLGEEVGWGCKHLNTIDYFRSSHRYYSRDANWYEFGRFSSNGVWDVDKSRINDLLSREAELKFLAICPFFDLQRAKEIVGTLPSTIEPEDSDTWEIEYEESVSGSVIEQAPIRIKPKPPSPEIIRLSLFDETETVGEQHVRYIPEVSFTDIGGIEEILETIREVVELPLKNPELLNYLSIKPHRGILLYGPPGCGKTLIAKAIANEVKAHFIGINGPEVLSKYYGESEQNLREVFEEARSLQPSVIFFDEIDSIAQRRTDVETARLESRLVNQLLTLMDGIEDYQGVSVIASTNRVELLDRALLRPGRFDYSIEVQKPTRQGCKKIFEIHAKNMPLSKDFAIEEFSPHLLGLSGAEIAFVAREGAYNCLRRNVNLKRLIEDKSTESVDYSSLVVTREDFARALRKVLAQADPE